MNSIRAAATSGIGRSIMIIVGFVLLAIAMYYLYKWLTGSSESQDVVVYTSPNTGLPAVSLQPAVFTQENLPAIYSGGEYSISTWIYISDWNTNNGKNKVFLTLTGGNAVPASSYKTLVLYLGQFINKLGIRTSNQTNSGAGGKLDSNQMTSILSGTTPYSDTSGDFKKCDVENIDLQKWVHITVVLSGRTVDVYIDGKLSRSCVMAGMFAVDGGNARLELGGPNGFGGLIGQTEAANFAYSPDRVYSIYQKGPYDTSIWTSIASWFNPSQYSFTLAKNGKTIASGSTASATDAAAAAICSAAAPASVPASAGSARGY